MAIFVQLGPASLIAPPATNVAPVFASPLPAPAFVQGTAAVFPPTGTYQTNGYATDADGDPIALAWDKTSQNGVTWDGGRFVYSGTGSGNISNNTLTADDGQGHSVGSAAFTITISAPASLSWQTLPNQSFVAGAQADVDLGVCVSGYNSGTDVFSAHPSTPIGPGTPLPWLTLTGTGGRTERASGAQTAGTFSVNLGVQRSGGTIVYTGPLTVTVTTAPALPTAGVYRTIGDSYNVVTGAYFTRTHHIPWRNNGGDWLDASGALQGNSAYTTAVVNGSLAPTTWSGTGLINLVTKWRTSGNSGARIRARVITVPDSRAIFSSRHGAAPPTLSVTIGGTAYNCPCTASLSIRPVQNYGLDNEESGIAGPFPDLYQEEMRADNLGPVGMMLQFDLSGVPQGTPSAATMRLTPTFYTGPANDLWLDVYEVNTPRIVIDPLTEAAIPPVSSPAISDGYEWDVGIGAHLDVVMATDFSPGFGMKWIDEPVSRFPPRPDEHYYNYAASEGDTTWPGVPGAISGMKQMYQGSPAVVAADSNFGGRYSLTWHYLKCEDDIIQGQAAGSSNARGGFRAVHEFSCNNEPNLDELWARIVSIPRGPPISNQGMKYGIEIRFNMGWQDQYLRWVKMTGNGSAFCRGQWWPLYMHPKTTYGPSATVMTITGGPWNGDSLYKLIGDGDSRPENSGMIVFGGTTDYDFGYAAPIGITVAMRARVTGFTGSGQYVSLDAAGEMHLTDVQHFDGTNWVDGLGATWAPSLQIVNELSNTMNQSDRDALALNPINLKGGEYGFYSGGTCRFGAQAIYMETDYRIKTDLGASFMFSKTHPNVTGILRAGDTVWLDHTLPGPSGNQYTYTGPDLNSDSNGEVVVAKANFSPSLVFPDDLIGQFFDCDSIMIRCQDSDPNPLKAYTELDFYVYDSDHRALGSGDTYYVGSHVAGWPMIGQDTMYNFEFSVKMNDVDPPFDQFGNGVGRSNGVLICEVDGVRFLEKTNVLWRRHPGLQINAFGYDATLGGQNFPVAVHSTGKTEGPMVFAKSRIGPIKQGPGGGPDPGSLPPWRQTNSAPWTLYNATVQGETAATKYNTHPTYKTYGGNPAMSVNSVTTLSIGAWSMGVIAEDMGTHGAFLTGMNGHEAGHGQIVQHLDIGLMQWQFPVLNDPTKEYYVATPGNINPPAGCDMFYVHSSVTPAEMLAAGYETTQPASGTGKWWDNSGNPEYDRWAFPTWTNDPVCQQNMLNGGQYLPGIGCSMRYDNAAVVPAAGGGEAAGTMVLMPSLFGHTFPNRGTIHAHRLGLTSRSWLAPSSNSERDLGGKFTSSDNIQCAYSEKYKKVYSISHDTTTVQIYDPATGQLSRKSLNTTGLGINAGFGNAVITNGLSGAHLFVFHAYRTASILSCLGVIDLDELEDGGTVNFYAIVPAGTTGVGANAFPRLAGVTFDYSKPPDPGYGSRIVHLAWAKTRKTLVLYQTVNVDQTSGFWIGLTSDPYTGNVVQPPANVLHTILVPETGATWKTNTWQGTHRTVSLGGGCKGIFVNTNKMTRTMYKKCSWSEKADCLLLITGGDTPVQQINLG